MNHHQKKKHREDAIRASLDNEQRKDERRKCKCQGYCYIEMVGWIDRRERERRKDHHFSC